MTSDMVMREDEIREVYLAYLEGMGDKERASEVAINSVNEFIAMSDKYLPSITMQNDLIMGMMDVAIEYEEDGFVAGFQTAINCIYDGALFLPDLNYGKSMSVLADSDDVSSHGSDSSSSGASSTKCESVKRNDDMMMSKRSINRYQKPDYNCITSIQISELFNTPHHKVCRRIENYFLPFLDDDSDAVFRSCIGKNKSNKDLKFYKLNRTACEMYLEMEEPKRDRYINIAIGYSKLQEMIEQTFDRKRGQVVIA